MLIGGIRNKYPGLPIHVPCMTPQAPVSPPWSLVRRPARTLWTLLPLACPAPPQPSIGAILASLEGGEFDPGLDGNQVRALDQYWVQVRMMYPPFEAWLTGTDPEVYEHEMSGGQLTKWW